MFLEKITLKGFKSFSNNTKVEFDEGMSIIVGPNGSGKSNINDAIKWVLGEGKKSELRASTSIDMIFNGTKHVAAAETAKVSLYFNNEKKKLNTKASKVKVTRKIERTSAKSTYYIDGEVARRKDIKNLFLGSGLGNTDLSIISQSSVTKLTEANPQEVKAILNEAAGVSGFMQTKKETSRDLQKVNDSKEIFEVKVNQLESRYNSLKKQSEKAIKFQSFRSELNEIELPFIFHKMKEDFQRETQISTEFGEQNNEIAQLKSELKILKSEISSSDTKNNKLRSKIQDLELKVNESKRAINSNTDDIEVTIKQTIADAKVLEGEINRIEENLSIAKSEKLTSSIKIREMFTELNTLKEHKNNLEVKKRIESSRNKGWVEKGTKYILDNRNVFPGAIGLLSNIIKYEDKYSVAVNEAMGAALRNLIVGTQDDAKQIIKTLRANKLGRTTIAPFKGRKPVNGIAEVIKNELSKYSGYIGTLDSVIKFSEKYERLVKSFSSRILVFENIDDASIAAKNLEYKYKIVTLEGDLILPGMILKGGSKSNNNKSIDFDSQIAEINKRIQEFTKEISKIQKSSERFNDKISEEESSKIKFVERKRYLEVNLNNHLQSFKQQTGKNYDFSNFKLEKEYISAEKAEIQISKLKAEFDTSYKKWTTSMTRESEIREKMIELVSLSGENKFELRDVQDRIKLHTDILINDYQLNMDMINPSEIKNIDTKDDSIIKRIDVLRKEIKLLGPVDVSSIKEFEEISSKYERSKIAYEEISVTHAKLTEILEDLEEKIGVRISETFIKVNKKFHESFQLLFKGGEALIEWDDEENIIESGINIIAQPPGKKLSSMKLFSGGEKTLTALSLIFAMNLVREIPLLILDEPEAALDEANVERFARFAKKVNQNSQVIVTTHRPGTMQQADNIFGVAMQERGITTIISVQLSEALKMAEE